MTAEKRDWLELCKAASAEHDSEQLRRLISELIRALDERNLDHYGPGSQRFLAN